MPPQIADATASCLIFVASAASDYRFKDLFAAYDASDCRFWCLFAAYDASDCRFGCLFPAAEPSECGSKCFSLLMTPLIPYSGASMLLLPSLTADSYGSDADSVATDADSF